MQVKVIEETVQALEDYGRVSIAYVVKTRFRVDLVRGGLGGFALTEEPVRPPYLKDYDQERGEGPTRWLKRWNISHWGVLSAYCSGVRMGGAVVAYDTEGVLTLEGRKDLAALWDIRVRPESRGRGIGTNLFQKAAQWARNKGCCMLKIETQNTNVPACRFYQKQGCELGTVSRFAYGTNPEEVQLIWYKSIA